MEAGKSSGKWGLFWRIQKVCLRRGVTPFLMYLFMSLLLLACQAFNTQSDTPIEIVLGVFCIICGIAFNAHLCYNYGIDHYDYYLTGCLHRKNALFGIESGGDHHIEREYRPYKGFLIGLYSSIPVIIFGIVAGACQANASSITGIAFYALVMFAAWAIIPLSWINNAGGSVSLYWSVFMCIIPIVVSGVFYIIGAMREKQKKAAENERMESVEKAGKEFGGKKKK